MLSRTEAVCTLIANYGQQNVLLLDRYMHVVAALKSKACGRTLKWSESCFLLIFFFQIKSLILIQSNFQSKHDT